jgi:hypothetical protein
MRTRSGKIPGLIVVGVAIQIAAVTAPRAAEPEGLPPFAKVEAVIANHFAKLSRYASLPDAERRLVRGDLITRGMVTPIFPQLEQIGWTVADRDRILERILPDNDFLVAQLSTPKGQAFWRQIRDYPQGIDRLDRMRQMPHGETTVSTFINKMPNGYTWIQAMTSTEGGERLAHDIARYQAGADFNKPTERIYVEEDLIAALFQSYQAELAGKAQ